MSVSFAAPLSAQEPISDEISRIGKLAVATFECAVLAAEGPDNIASMASPLATQGKLDYLPFAEALTPIWRDSPINGPLSDFMSLMNAEFLSGLAFAKATQTVVNILDKTAPFDGSGSYESIRLLRGRAAAAEFDRRNCRLLLQ